MIFSSKIFFACFFWVCVTLNSAVISSFEDGEKFLEKFSVITLKKNKKMRISKFPFELKDGQLSWTNVRSNIEMMLFRSHIKFISKGENNPTATLTITGASIWNGTSHIGLAVFTERQIQKGKSGDGFTFTEKCGKLKLSIWKDGTAKDIKIGKIRVKPGVKLQIIRASENVYRFSYKNAGGKWKVVFESDAFKNSSQNPEFIGIYAVSGWWKGNVTCDDFIIENCKVESIMNKPVSCLILSDKATLPLHIWQKYFSLLGVKCMINNNPRELDKNTDISKLKYIIIDLGRINEGFARKIENWIKVGGTAIIYKAPKTYTRNSKASGTVAVPIILNGKKVKIMQGLIRATRSGAYGKGILNKIVGVKDTIIYKKLLEQNALQPAKRLNVYGLHLMTGFSNRDFGNMRLLSAEIINSKGIISTETVAIRNIYGKGSTYYTTLPLAGSGTFATALRNAIFAQIKQDLAIPIESKPLYNNPPGVAIATGKTLKGIEEIPKRPNPPAKCILELQGDEFTGAIGSPRWAPWRIALCNNAKEPISKTFKLNSKGALWMEIQGAFGDHRESPLMKVEFNGKTLMYQKAPWRRIPFHYSYYRVLYPIRFYIPKEMLKNKNTLKIFDLGLEWFILDYVRFYPAAGKDSLKRIVALDKIGKYEYKALKTKKLVVDGNLNETAWEKADWKILPGNPLNLKGKVKKELNKGKKAKKKEKYIQTKFALASDQNNLFIGVKTIKDTVAQLAVSYPGCKSAYLFSFDQNNITSCVNYDGEVIIGVPMKSASKKLKDGSWSMEASIPLSCIPAKHSSVYRPNIRPRTFLPMGGQTQFNFFRRSRIGRDGAEWESFLPFKYFGKDTSLLVRTKKTRIPYPFMYDNLINASLFTHYRDFYPVKWPAYLKWGKNSVRVNNKKGVYAYVKVVIRNKGHRQVTKLKLDKDVSQVSFVITMPGENEVSLELYDINDNLSELDMRSVKLKKPFNIKTGRSFYTTEKKASLLVFLNHPKETKFITNEITAELYLSDGKIQRVIKKVSDNVLKFNFDISKLSPGKYETYITTSFNGRKYSQASPPIKIFPASKTEVKLRADGFMLLNDKPFYPMGILIDQYRINSDLTFIKKGGLNTAIIWKNLSKKALQKAKKDGINLILATTGTHGGAGNWMVDYNGTFKHLLKTRNQSSVIGYYPVDEPEYWHAPNCVPLQLKKFNEFAAKIDPYRPSMISHGIGNIHYGKSEGMTFNDAVDIRLWERYGNPEAIAKRMDEMKNYGKNDRAVSWAFLRIGGSPIHKLVSSIQFRAEGYTAFISGCRGIVYFLQRMARWNGAEHWPEVSNAMSGEIQKMAASRMKESSVVLDSVSGTYDIRTMVWIDGSNLWIAAVNIIDKEKSTEIEIEKAKNISGNLKPKFKEMPNATIKKGILKIKLDAYGVGCWIVPLKQ